ncbi:stage III sporulation protein AG [Caloramator quimbayensis]|uniref:Stage III sporulation protein AG n=1 Tax=Caloramator quimbayensis TaxID=1147123 RepID=A0A1T4WX80_9CLOT|nr:stage III sporulation protein AG [Caloramator quimbayensis]SKA81963.1 stage III sporulation protein AG [Caloramator quimbayensis]
MNLKKFIEKLNSNRKKSIYYLIVLLLCGVLLILIGDITSTLYSKKSKETKNTVEVNTNSNIITTSQSFEDKVKKDLIDTLSQIQGVGKVSVMIYFEGGSESVPALNVNDTNKKVEEKDSQGGVRVTTEMSKNQNVVIISEGGNSKPYIIKQINPSIGGVMVVAEGANSSEIKERILNSVKTVLNIPASKVSVMPMKK